MFGFISKQIANTSLRKDDVEDADDDNDDDDNDGDDGDDKVDSILIWLIDPFNDDFMIHWLIGYKL